MDAPGVTLELGVSGWYAIHVGIWNPHYSYDGDFKLKLKLTSDPCFTNISDPEPELEWPGKVEFKEIFFKSADLTDQDLVIGQHNKETACKAFLGYVKLVPLSSEQVAAIQQDRARTATRNLYALNDGNGLFYKGPTTEKDLLEGSGAVSVFRCRYGSLLRCFWRHRKLSLESRLLLAGGSRQLGCNPGAQDSARQPQNTDR